MIFRHKSALLVIVLVLVLLLAKGFYALTCLYCENAPSLRNCTRFTKCWPEQACYIEKYLNERSFETVYRAGCKNMHECKLEKCNQELLGKTELTTKAGHALSSTTTKYERYKRNLVVCTQCCYNDTCNTNGCGSSYYGPTEFLHCFHKDKVVTNEVVQTVQLCRSNEVCFSNRNIYAGVYGYRLGCFSKRLCAYLAQIAIAKGTKLDTTCCDRPLCNVNPLSKKTNISSVYARMPCPTALMRSTPPTSTTSRLTSTDSTITMTRPTKLTMAVPTNMTFNTTYSATTFTNLPTTQTTASTTFISTLSTTTKSNQSIDYFSEGQTVRLTCSITNKIPGWTFPTGQTINLSGSSIVLDSFPHRDRYAVNPAGDLVIESPLHSDSGQYTCSYPGSGNQRIHLLMTDPAIIG